MNLGYFRVELMLDGPFAIILHITYSWRSAEIDGNVLDRPSRWVNQFWKTMGAPRTDRYPLENQVSVRSGRSGGFSNMIFPSGRPVVNVSADLWWSVRNLCIRFTVYHIQLFLEFVSRSIKLYRLQYVGMFQISRFTSLMNHDSKRSIVSIFSHPSLVNF